LSEHKVFFLPGRVGIKVETGTTVREAAIEAGVELEGPCGGKGTCGKCLVLLSEKEEGRWVLACRTAITGDVVVEIPHLEVSLYRKSELSQKEISVVPDPGVQKIACQTRPPSLENQTADAERLLAALGREAVDFKLGALRFLPGALKRENGLVTAVLAGDQILAVEAGDTGHRLYGLAVDIGTTTVVAVLVDLLSGESLAAASATNSQNIFGADVIARIEYAGQHSQGLAQLERRVAQVINRLIDKLTQAAGVSPGEIYQVAVAGNTTMNHLFLGLDPANLAPSPFIPVATRLSPVEAGDVELAVSPHAPVYLLPNIAGYVGGDTVGVIISTGIDREPGIHLAVDIGTNGEIVLAVDGRLSACSAAAGPAFEGAQIRHGMRAAAGAIEGVSVDSDVHLKIIGQVPARGICGSGLMDAVAGLLQAGVIETGGRIISRDEAGHLPGALQQRLNSEQGGNFFVLASREETGAEPVVLTQKDVRELQLAKAAIRAGIEILLGQAGLIAGDIDQVLLAGAFGSYIDKNSALSLGLLPPVAPERITPVGNAAGAGARLALLSAEIRQKAATLARQVQHVELSVRPDFQERFIDALGF